MEKVAMVHVKNVVVRPIIVNCPVCQNRAKPSALTFCSSALHMHNTTTSRTFTTTKFPESVAALKLAIQEEFQVPVYDQKLSFDCAAMADGESLDFYRLKDEDQITLEYTTTVDVECAFRLMSLLRNALEFVKNEQSQLASGKISPEFSKTITDTLHVKDINQCIRQLFPPQKMFANSMFILNNRGLDVTTSLHSLLLNQTWEQICHLELQHLEYNVLMVLHNLFMVTRQHEVINNLDNVLGSFLRVPISSKPIIVPHNRNLYSSTKHKQLEALNGVVTGALLCLNTYFVVMVISNLALTKAARLPEKLSSQVELLLNRFLRSVDFNLFCMWMVKARRYVWADIFPPLSLAYSPLRYTSLCPIDSLCLEAAVMRLQIIVSKDGERHCLIKQGLLDYLICLPWHISEGLEAHKRAKLVSEMFGSHIPLQPPSLNNIVRAKLAATCCGLAEAMRSDCHRSVGWLLPGNSQQQTT
ncbi:hypothetical protein EMCRGX_G006971 [Ephydatia muelleri]|eukprot:Em0002g1493a